VVIKARADIKSQQYWAVASISRARDRHEAEKEFKIGDVMVTTSFISCAVVLALMSVLWVHVTRREHEKSRADALLAHLDWRPAPKSKAKNRTAPQR
jgi:hypothetical protein